MGKTYDEVFSNALTLSLRECVRLARGLVASLEDERSDPTDVKALWLAEAERRMNEIKSGAVETLDGQEALERARRKLLK